MLWLRLVLWLGLGLGGMARVRVGVMDRVRVTARVGVMARVKSYG